MPFIAFRVRQNPRALQFDLREHGSKHEGRVKSLEELTQGDFFVALLIAHDKVENFIPALPTHPCHWHDSAHGWAASPRSDVGLDQNGQKLHAE